MTRLRLGTRGSQLARWQAHAVADRLDRVCGLRSELVIIRTAGDQLADARVSDLGGKRLFVKEIEDALMRGEIDLAIHSAKDIPAVLPDGLAINAVLPREDPRDAAVLPDRMRRPETTNVEQLLALVGSAPRVGTSSVRRTAQLTRLMPHATFTEIRGNLDTRLAKLDRGEYDLLILAVAGLLRLGFAGRVSARLPIGACVPAPGQGAIAVENRLDDAGVVDVLASINDEPSNAAVVAERALVAALGGGCQVPIGAVALPLGDDLELQAVVTSLDGDRALRARGRAPLADATSLGRRVADQLERDGARAILDEVGRARAPVQGLQP